MPIIVAIDGPAGAGKSTIAAQVAVALDFAHVDTGAIYRAITLLALEGGIHDETVPLLLENLDLRFSDRGIYLKDRDLTAAIRTPEITEHVSRIAALPSVRENLLPVQRRLGRAHPKGAVMEGRDIGTVVFPDAEIKIFLTASAEERARRRAEDLRQAGRPHDRTEVLESIQRRDTQDSERATSPLRAAEDAFVLDSTGITIDEVVQMIVQRVKDRP